MQRATRIGGKSKTAAVCLALAAGSLAPATGCSGKAEATAESKKGKLVQVEPIGRADLKEVLVYVADLKPTVEIKIYSTVPDRILYFPWKDGDEIKRGQRIALIRSEGLGKGLEGLAAQLEALDVQIKSQEDDVRRSELLLKSGALNQQTYDKQVFGLEATRAQRKALEANRGQLAITASNASIESPIDGVIAGKLLEKGDMAVPQMPLCRVLAIEQLTANLALIEEDVRKVQVGQKVELHLDAYPGRTFGGAVTAVMPYLDAQTRTNNVEVTIDNSPDPETDRRLLKPGMYGRAELVVAERRDALVAPEQALLLDNKILEQQKPGETLRKVFVVKGDAAEQRLVKVGARKGSLLEVLDGLGEGERIVVRGQHELRGGDKIEIATASN
ncbi:MAG: efflux RND transporter periplasmic adaptor subunit [Deltaproteobacteria bacterium]|nr:efflux RND transporter periplasmic adaptor subunit [Deltaproteobacteria bacterium]